jgi:ATP-dependent Zn protease
VCRKNPPAIIFIDEIDALGGKRKLSVGGAERQTLNQLLSSMDGFSKNDNIIVIGATNAPEVLDAALVRPGRFDTTVNVPLPDVLGRKAILELYLKKVVTGPGIDSALLARATPGFSGAQVRALLWRWRRALAAHTDVELLLRGTFNWVTKTCAHSFFCSWRLS